MKIAQITFICMFSFGLTFGSIDSLIESVSQYESTLSVPSFRNNIDSLGFVFPKINQASFEEQEKKFRFFLSELKNLDESLLSKSEKIDKSVLELKLADQISYYQYKLYLIPFGAEGGFYTTPVYMIKGFEIKNLEEGNTYLNWLQGYCKYLEDYKEYLKNGISSGIMAPKVIVNNMLLIMDPFCNPDPLKNPLYDPFSNISETLNDKEIKHLSTVSITAFNDIIIPQYQELYRFIKNEYLPRAYNDPGILNIPSGKKYYENRVRHYTTLPLSANEIHETGMKEVKRIKARMQKLIVESGYEGSFEEFLNYLRTDPQFYAQSPEELLYFAAWLSKKAEGELPKYFKELPSLPFTVEPVPSSIAATYTSGRYSHGSWKNKTAGAYWVNTFKLDSRPLYAMPALTLHEAVPGHHLQNQLVAEQDNVSDLRRHYYISAFGEGWGLYSEYLGEEMGMYSDEYELFGRFTYEMWRACRLVVDTGIHFKGWSREKAIEFLKSNTALSIHEVNTEIDRYIGWPGQALSYKVGEMKIIELRKKAKFELGDAFDIRDFHYEILKNGSIPLSVLESEIEAYIESNN